jgi:trigger factor
MNVKNIEKKENNSASFQVETDKAEFEAAVNKAYLKAKRDIYIPGFRKGKAPRAVIEGMYGAEVFYEDAIDALAPDAFEAGIKESELKMVGAPSISDVKVTDDKTVEYTFAVTLYPEVTLGQYKGLEAAKEEPVVAEEKVDEEINAVRKRNARMLSVEDRAAAMGDTANIDFDGYLNGEQFDGGKADAYELELGSGSFVPGFEEQVVGMNVGEEKDINITFPENYVEDLAGKDVVFKVKLNSLTTAELPELDDEFAKDVSEFDTLEEYKADIRANLEKAAKEQAENKFRADILRQACDNIVADIPAVMVDEKLEEMIRGYAANYGMSDRNVSLDKLKEMMGLNDEMVNSMLRPGAEFQVKNDLLIDAIVKAENIEVTDEDVEEYLKKVGEDVKASPEDLKQYFGIDFIKEECKKDKANSVIFDSAVVGEAKPAEEAKSEETAE